MLILVTIFKEKEIVRFTCLATSGVHYNSIVACCRLTISFITLILVKNMLLNSAQVKNMINRAKIFLQNLTKHNIFLGSQ